MAQILSLLAAVFLLHAAQKCSATQDFFGASANAPDRVFRLGEHEPSVAAASQLAESNRRSILRTKDADQFKLPPCNGELRDRAYGCWLHEYVTWHRANRAKPDAKYLLWVCFGPGGPGASRARTANIYGDNCAGLGDRMRGIQYLTRVAAATKRVLLVYQESPAPMERFLSPALIDWRLTPDLGLDPERDVVQSGKHYRISASDRNKLREDISSGVFQTLTARVVTVCTNKPSHTDGSGSIPKVSINGTALGVLARALFRLSPEVEEATDDALLKIGIRRGQAYVAAHVRLGGLSGEEKLLGRFSQDPPQILAAAAACAANLTAAYGMQPGAPAAAAAAAAPAAEAEAAAGATADLPYVLVTDNDQLRQQVAAGKLRPWITPELHPAHFTVSRLPGSEEQPQRQQQQQSRGQESELEESHEEVGPGEDGEDSIKAEAEEGTQAQQRRRLAEELRRKRRRRRIPQAKRGGGGGSGRSGSDEGGVAELAASAASGSGGGSRRAVALREQRDTAQQAAVQEELARLQVLNMADLGILMRATCVLISPSGFSIQAHLLSDQPCAMRLQHCPGAT